MADLPFPRSLPEIQELFPDDRVCASYMERARWTCDDCGETRCICPTWEQERRQIEAANARRLGTGDPEREPSEDDDGDETD